MVKSMNDKYEKFRNKLECIKHTIDPSYLLTTLGFNIKNMGNDFRCPCIIHGGDNNTAFKYNTTLDTWVCFTHKCHEKYGNDIIGLIRGIHKCDFMTAVNTLEELGGSSYVDGDYTKHKYNKEKTEFLNTYKKNIHNCEAFEDELNYGKKFRSDRFLKDGFLADTLDNFEISGGHMDKYGYQRDIIPIRNDCGIIVGMSYRDIRDIPDNDYKYIHSSGFNKDLVLYNLHNARNFIANKPLIIVEGYKSVWKLYELGINNVSAIMGSSLTIGQMNLIYKYVTKGIVIMLDNDMAGITGLSKIIKVMKNKIDIYPVFITETFDNGKGKDPSDLTNEQLTNYLEGYI